MNCSNLVFLLLLVGAASATWSYSERLQEDYDLDFKELTDFWSRLHRSRRAPASPERFCGAKLPPRIYAACNHYCEPGTGTNLATTCCAVGCTADDIKKACCPQLA